MASGHVNRTNRGAASGSQSALRGSALTPLSTTQATAAKNYPSKRLPELTPATYQVVYSDGVTQETSLLPPEIENWVSASNQAEAD